jgi:hypothetical protein
MSVTLGGTGKPVKLQTPGGSKYTLRAVTSTGAVAFDSGAADREAIAPIPVDQRPGETMVVQADESDTAIYTFTAKNPGRYTVTVATFSPSVSTKPLTIIVP